MENKLKVIPSKFKTDLTFNEWAELLKVSSMYEERTPYYTGNLSKLDPSLKYPLYESVDSLSPKVSLFKKLKTTIKLWREKTS
jgi:hypothetical protein